MALLVLLALGLFVALIAVSAGAVAERASFQAPRLQLAGAPRR